jgi:hypothetical protein
MPGKDRLVSGVEFEDREVRLLAADLMAAAVAAPAETRKVVARGAFQIKADARRRRSGSKYFPRLKYAISYDSHETPTGGWAEIGPDVEKPQGNMGHIPEYGALKTPAEPYMAPAAEAEMPKFERAMQDLAARLLGDR